MTAARPSVVVVGAGIAGLTGAEHLAAAGFDVTVVEARSRLGGRIQTQYDFAGVPVERGAEFVHGRYPELIRMAEGAGLHLSRRAFSPLVLQAGRDVSPSTSWQRVLEELANPHARDEPIARHAGRLVESGAWTQAEVRTLRRYVEGYMAADFERASALALSEETRAADRIDGDFNARIAEGYDALVRHLAARLEPPRATVLLETAVERICWRRGAVTLHVRRAGGEAGVIRTERVLVTLPLGVLQLARDAAGAVAFEPDLGEKNVAAAKLAMGNVIKLFLRFGSPLSSIDGVAGEIGEKLDAMTFLQTPDGPLPTWWPVGDAKAPVLIGWMGGSSAERLSGRHEQELIRLGIATLASALGVSEERIAAKIELAGASDWSRDPWSRGAYSWVPAGSTGAASVLASPVEETLYFAGEATDTAGYRGTVHGAIHSALRAAAEIKKGSGPFSDGKWT